MPEDASSISIEETNRIRISLGLKPLRVDPETAPGEKQEAKPDENDNSTEAQERRAVENWKKLQDEKEKEERRKRAKEEIAREREKFKRHQILEGKGLADEDDDDESALSWIKNQKKRQKKISKELAEKEARDRKQKKDYTEDEVKSLRVAHDVEDIMDRGSEGAILTLKDATIDELEEEGDELEDIALAEKERLEERLQLKKKKPGYNIYEEEDEHGNKQKILAQYDDEIDGKKKKQFVLGEVLTAEQKQARKQELAEKLKQTPVALEVPSKYIIMLMALRILLTKCTEPELAVDYLDPSEIKVKKPKKKKTKARQRPADEEDILNPAPAAMPAEEDSKMDIDGSESVPQRAPKRSFQDISFIDDEDLQSSLAIQRRKALKKRKILKPEDVAKQVREEAEANGIAGEDSPVADEEVGLVIDETSEFVSHLRAPEEQERPKRKTTPPPRSTGPTAMADEDSDNEGDARMTDAPIKTEPEEGDVAETPAIPTTGLEEETTLDRGIGSTLAMLTQRGLLKKDPEAEKTVELFRERQKFLTEKRLKQLEAERKAKLQRERDRASGKYDRMSAREREEQARWENKQRDQAEAREIASKFKDYKPDVKLVYRDEFGRDLNQKEAFKHLSHQFHGKGSGKAKTEKRLKKIEDEKKREAASTLTSNVGMSSSMAATAKKSKQAGVRLM